MQRIISAFASAAETGSMRWPVPITVAGPRPAIFAKNFQSDLHIVLPESSQRAADRIQQEPLSLVDRFLREMFVSAAPRPSATFSR
jgi:hypothetical protein